MPQYQFLGPAWQVDAIEWSFAPAGTTDGSHVVSDAIDVSLRPLIRAAFARWSEVSGLGLHEVVDPAAAEILVGWGSFGATGGQIGEAACQFIGSALTSVLVRLEDPDERPLVTTGDGQLVYANTQARLYTLALHEIGHSLGLAHSDDLYSVMYATITARAGDLSPLDVAGVRALYPALAALQFTLVDPATSATHYAAAQAYAGPVASLRFEFLGGPGTDIVGGTGFADFVNALAGNDAIDGGGGDDVLDGGAGSNFLTGGDGRDVFFLDGRGVQSTWSTITDWQAGEQLCLWGWRPGTSQAFWFVQDGLVGYRGATLHVDLDADGRLDTSVTFVGVRLGELPPPFADDGLLWLV